MCLVESFQFWCLTFGFDVFQALAAFERSLVLDPTNPSALFGVAVLRDRRRRYEASSNRLFQFIDFQAAYAATDYCPPERAVLQMMNHVVQLHPLQAASLNHLANHYFWNWQSIPLKIQATEGSAYVTCKYNPTTWLREGMALRLTLEDEIVFEVQLTRIHLSSSTWMLVLSSPIPLTGKNSCESFTHECSVSVCDLPRIEELAKQACRNSMDEQVCAEACMIIGRNRHAHGDTRAAIDNYQKAREHAPNDPLACYRHAQIQAINGSSPEQKL